MRRVVNDHGSKANKNWRRALLKPFDQVLEWGNIEVFLDRLLHNLFVGEGTHDTDLLGPTIL